MVKRENNPIAPFIRQNMMPSVWCPGCGIGVVVNTFLQTVQRLKFTEGDICLVSSGISCTGKIADYLTFKRLDAAKQDVFKAALDFKRKNKDLKVFAFANDNDLLASGADGLIDLCRSGADVVVIYINSYTYQLFTEHRKFNTAPFIRNTNVAELESPFNLPHLAAEYGASYVARWTPLHCRRLSFSIKEALYHKGVAFIEVISPCLMYFSSEQGPGITLDRMGLYLSHAVIKENEPFGNLDTRNKKEIIIGRFLNR